MINAQDIKNGTCIRMDGKLYFCIEFLHVKPGKGNTFMRTKLKDVVSGYVLERRFNIGERLIAHVAAGGRGDEISGDRCEQGERFLSSEIAVGMTVHHIVDAFMPYRRARRCVVTSAIGFLRWLESWSRQPYHQDDKCHGKDEAYRDNDAQPRFDMNRVQCVEIVARQGDVIHALPPKVSEDGALS